MQIIKHGKVASVTEETAEQAQTEMRNLLADYSPDDVFNMDETGLFYKMPPDCTLATQKIAGTKRSKDRITVGLCCNSTGSESLKPTVIGKSKNPWCFKKFDPKRLVHYYVNMDDNSNF